MTTSEQTVRTLIAKVDAFSATLSPDEQCLLAELIGGGQVGEVEGFVRRRGWPGMANVLPSPVPRPIPVGDDFADIVMGGTDV